MCKQAKVALSLIIWRVSFQSQGPKCCSFLNGKYFGRLIWGKVIFNRTHIGSFWTGMLQILYLSHLSSFLFLSFMYVELQNYFSYYINLEKKKKIEQSFGKDNMISLDFYGIGPLKNNNLNLCYKSIQQKSNCWIGGVYCCNFTEAREVSSC